MAFAYVEQQHAKKRLNHQIRARLEEMGIDQKQLAKMLKMPETTVSYWLTHPERLSAEKWAKLNTVLHLTVDNFAVAAGFRQAVS